MPRRPVSLLLAVFVFFALCIYSTSRISQTHKILAFSRSGHTSTDQLPLQHAIGASKLRPSTTTANPTENANEVNEEEASVPREDGPQSGQSVRAKAAPDSREHPIRYLINEARQAVNHMAGRQSQNLQQAVEEYRRRYGIPPPPNFDKWFQFAKKNQVQLIDEFDTIHELLTPFWGLRPKTIRARTREALGYDNALIGVAVRNHQISHLDGGTEWQRNATHGMLQRFLEYLPDMDLAFNIHDEPRVIVPHDDLTRLVHKAKHEYMPAANANTRPVNDFSKTSPELSSKMVFEQVKQSRFNSFGRQSTWTHSRISCSPESPARVLEDDERRDEVGRYGVGELGFVYNSTALTDICLSPSLSSTHGFFDRPNIYKVVHDLFPIFSQSKISSYNDIIYPAPWYYWEKVKYKQADDQPWDEKKTALYWRGSTTGGFSRDGGWRRQHRQHFVRKINAGGRAKIMTNRGGGGGDDVNNNNNPDWGVTDVARADYTALTDVAFSHVGQCDAGDCQAQQAFFNVTSRVNQTDAWAYKYLLDIDGNAFSGRFLAFLKSMSLTFKFALFREWHTEWLTPWVHYVPLSLQGEDWLETVRFFSEAGLGEGDARVMAKESREWAGKAMRREDMEAWFFRLLLEYARVIDDERAIIGYDPASSGKRLS